MKDGIADNVEGLVHRSVRLRPRDWEDPADHGHFLV